MTESERPHRTGRSTSDFFICFSSRSSSSMKISSKSILSPGRTDKFREPTLSLSSSLSRRLRSNGSMKGGQSSPMFPTGSKKKGCSFETAEPSSPKVTCIGQVRVKTKKKQGKKMRTRSKRRGEVSFRKTEQTQEGIIRQQQQQDCLSHRNQRWVHLPLVICEALRALGADFNCFLPCGGRSSCSWSSERKVEKRRTTSTTTTTTSSCGAVFAKWLWDLQESEENKRETEFVVREEETRETRGKVDVVEMDNSEEKEQEKEEIDEEEEEGRVSICIPPRNALLLMRCRSEPFRMSAFSNRFWDSTIEKDENDEDEENVEEQAVVEEEEFKEVKLELEEEKKEETLEKWVSAEVIEEFENPPEEENPDKEERQNEENLENAEQLKELHDDEELEHKEEEIVVNGCSPEALENGENNLEKEAKLQEEEDEEEKDEGEEKEEEKGKSRESFSSSTLPVQAGGEPEAEPELAAAAALEERVEKSTKENRTKDGNIEEETDETRERSATEADQKQQYVVHEEEEEESREREGSLLPDCLLLMMCEPKLSMEVSKETWVCSTDFIRRRHPENQVVPVPLESRDKCKKRISTDSNPAQVHPAEPQHQEPQQQLHHHQKPPRSSCSKLEKSVDPSMATMIEQKFVNADKYEPLVLTRCKSEPMRSSAKLAPEACFWKNRKMEPHHTLGVGAAGIGF